MLNNTAPHATFVSTPNTLPFAEIDISKIKQCKYCETPRMYDQLLISALTITIPSLSVTEDGLNFPDFYIGTQCIEENDDKVFDCFESINVDIINSSFESSLHQSNFFETKPFFIHNTFAYSIILPPQDGWKQGWMQIYLNANTSYLAEITDPKLQLNIDKPGIIPRKVISLKQKEGCHTVFYKV